MKSFALAVLTLTTVAVHAQSSNPVDFSLCNDVINKTFMKDKTFPNGFITINTKGQVEAAQCGSAKSKCSVKSFNRLNPSKEEFKVTQDSSFGPFKQVDRSFTVYRNGNGQIEKIVSEADELQISYTSKKCVATALIAEIPEENVREMNFDLVACKTFYEIQKRYGQKLSDCFAKDVETLKNSSDKSVTKFGVGCSNELKDVYKNLQSLKSDIISRYENDKSLKRQPFKSIVPPSVFNDQVIENFLCSYEAVNASAVKNCDSNIFNIGTPSETAIGVILGNKKTCGLIYSDAVLGNQEIFKAKSPDSLVFTLLDAKSGSGSSVTKGGGTKGAGQ